MIISDKLFIALDEECKTIGFYNGFTRKEIVSMINEIKDFKQKVYMLDTIAPEDYYDILSEAHLFNHEYEVINKNLVFIGYTKIDEDCIENFTIIDAFDEDEAKDIYNGCYFKQNGDLVIKNINDLETRFIYDLSTMFASSMNKETFEKVEEYIKQRIL